MAEQHSGLCQLPTELLIKIINQMDNQSILACTQTSPFLKSVGLDILLQRHNITDPSVYCEVKVIVFERLSRTDPADALSALLADRSHYDRVKHLDCTILPPKDYAFMFISKLPHTDLTGPSAEPLESRLVQAFERLKEFLSRVDAVEEVTLRVSFWVGLPEGLSGLLEDLIQLLVRKGCTVLQLKCPDPPFNRKLRATQRSPSWRFALSKIFSGLACRLFGSRTVQGSRKDHHRLSTSSISVPPALPSTRSVRSRITKLHMNGSFFHPFCLSWMSDFLSLSPLASFTVSFDHLYTPNATQTWFIDRGLSTLLRAAPQLQSLTVLQANDQTAQHVATHLRPFRALKSLTICVDGATPAVLSGEGAVPFLPGSLERLSISPQLIDYILLGTVTATRLEEFEVVYRSRHPADFTTIARDVSSIRSFFERISAAVSIGVRVWANMHATRHVLSVSESSLTTASSSSSFCRQRILWVDEHPFPYLAHLLEPNSQMKDSFGAVHILHIESSPFTLETRQSIDGCVKVLGMFPAVKKVVLSGPVDFREEGPARDGAGLSKEEVERSVVPRVYTNCKELTSLRIGEEEYLRPLVEV